VFCKVLMLFVRGGTKVITRCAKLIYAVDEPWYVCFLLGGAQHLAAALRAILYGRINKHKRLGSRA